ncbi:UDP-N-acetylmuramoyl-L-alanine--D-glutamate ligase [Bryobacter aggregatus]|uniref:UDP-N-acetylmuramoyl-L-alanine--D-glutamate ligase n=1 Tax=Bryobacter aggregatus TaxID=360054 RepID=UPI0004E22AEA|nr:UDP-N-acetylmuramoyl-L-alanine--D-glutamate ligase [Bryobacter aggregatus]
MRFSGQHVLVLGLARSGVGAIHLLRSHGARVTGVDSRTLADLVDVQKLVEKSEISYAKDVDASLQGIDCVVVSPGVPATHPLLQDARHLGIPVLGEIELAYLFLRGPILAITGSNGKTTTTSLVGHILKEGRVASQVGGNIGYPATEMTAASTYQQWNVLELSSFQLESVHQFHAELAAVLNVTPNHLDRHGDFDSYAAAKAKIFANQRNSDWAVLNGGNAASAAYAAATPANLAVFQGPAAQIDDDWIELFGTRLMPIRDIRLPGKHNLENVMAAAVLTSLAGAERSDIANAVATFQGVRHRLEFVRNRNGVKFYNDSKATSVDATVKALEALDGPLWVILGGLDKGGSYLPLLPLLQEKAKSALLIGKAAPIIEEQLRGKINLQQSGDMATAIAFAASQAQPGDTILLAPACASYDQFRSYEDRGDQFRQAVEQL